MFISRFLCMLTVAAISQACCAEVPALTIQGVVYSSTCDATERQALKQQLDDAAGGNQPESLRSLVVMVLCGKGAKADEAMRRASDPRVKLTVVSTGGDQPTVTRVPRAGLKAYGGAAWSTYADSGDDGVSMHFYKNEACMETLIFSSRERAWRLVAMAEACD